MLKGSFNEAHVLAVSQALCRSLREQSIDGPLFARTDTHALSAPVLATAVEVFSANGVGIFVDGNDATTPRRSSPTRCSATIMEHARPGRRDRPQSPHNPPEDGGYSYNPPHGGPLGTDVRSLVATEPSALLAASAPT